MPRCDAQAAYRSGKRKLDDALAGFSKAGTDAQAYRRAASEANQARDLFASAIDEAKRAKAARPAAVARVVPQPVVVPPPVPAPVVVAPQPEPQPVQIVEKPLAIPERGLTPSTPPAAPAPKVTVIAKTPDPIEPAYRAFARGELANAEQMLTSLIGTKASAHAYLLRGCTRYTRAMLSRNSAPLLANAASDFKAALKLNRTLRLDKASFSPKLIAYFEAQRK